MCEGSSLYQKNFFCGGCQALVSLSGIRKCQKDLYYLKCSPGIIHSLHACINDQLSLIFQPLRANPQLLDGDPGNSVLSACKSRLSTIPLLYKCLHKVILYAVRLPNMHRDIDVSDTSLRLLSLRGRCAEYSNFSVCYMYMQWFNYNTSLLPQDTLSSLFKPSVEYYKICKCHTLSIIPFMC